MSLLSLDGFVEIYFSSVVETISNTNTLSHNEFYKSVFDKIKLRTGLHKSLITYLHHSFHWVLFLEELASLSLISCKEGYLVKKISQLNKSQLRENLLKKYKNYLEIRIKNVNDPGFVVPFIPRDKDGNPIFDESYYF